MYSSNNRKKIAGGIVAALFVVSAFLLTGSAFGDADKVWICHGTSSGSYVVINVARAAWEEGHTKHIEHHGDLGPEHGVPQPATGDPAIDCVGEAMPPT